MTAAAPFRNDVTGDVGVRPQVRPLAEPDGGRHVNTDFAQIEEDLQQINLTRFSLLFPEKRDFFLEGQGILRVRRPQPLGPRIGGDTDDVPVMFFSRQIGLPNGQTIPVIAGGRVTGKAGPFDIAALNIETAEKESADVAPTNFTAVRVRRDILRRSNVGVIATARQPEARAGHQHGVGRRRQHSRVAEHHRARLLRCAPTSLDRRRRPRATGRGSTMPAIGTGWPGSTCWSVRRSRRRSATRAARFRRDLRRSGSARG